jgi:hypothetical protein
MPLFTSARAEILRQKKCLSQEFRQGKKTVRRRPPRSHTPESMDTCIGAGSELLPPEAAVWAILKRVRATSY